MPFRFRRSIRFAPGDVFTVVIWVASLFGAADIMALLFLWMAE